MKTQCIACGAKLKFLGENSGAKIFQCPICGLGMTEDAREEELYSAYHRDPVYIAAREQFRNIFVKRVAVIEKFKHSGKALEVGSSTGLLLSLLADRGWEVLGVEPSKTAVKTALDRGVPTINKTFEEAETPKGNLDLVIFNHVLEHMDDPRLVLKKAKRVLKKDGLVLIDVPNFASLAARVGGTSWKYILPKEHKWHFTPTSLFALLDKAGFKPLYWEAHSGIWGYGNPALEIWQSLGKKRFFWNVATAVPTWFLTKLKTGTGLTIIAKKK